MDERITTPLPMWIASEGGDLLNLTHMAALTTGLEDAQGHVDVLAYTASGDDYTLATCDSLEMAQAALTKLAGLLPMAVVDMTLDVIAPLEREYEAAQKTAGGAA